MKNTTERTSFHRLLFGFIPVLFLLLGTACEKDAAVDGTTTRIIGTWHQTSKAIDDNTAPIDSSRLIMQINKDNICILCDSSKIAVKAKTILKRSGWSYTGGLFNLAIDLPASWKPLVDASTLTLERVDFKPDGALSKTRLTFKRVADMEIK